MLEKMQKSFLKNIHPIGHSKAGSKKLDLSIGAYCDVINGNNKILKTASKR